MIIVDSQKCTACALCARICHETCITLEGENNHRAAQIDHSLCSTCTQCIAICPQQALSWDRASPVSYDNSRLPSAEQIAELFKQRRTVRRFTEAKIDRASIAEIVGYGIYAPTNHYALRAVVVDDPAIMEALTPALDAKGKVKMERGLEEGRAFDTLPAALVFVAGDRRVLLSEASAQYALYNMILYAQVNGIGSRINAAGPLALDRSRAARKRLGLQKREHILATLELGYPAVRFRNKVEGKAMNIQWNGGLPDS